MTILQRRTILTGGAVAALSAAAATPNERPRNRQMPPPGSGINIVTNISDLAALEPVAGSLVYLAEPGRAGLFRCVQGAPPVSDPLEGLFVRAGRDAFHFARDWDGIRGMPEWFGARVGDPRADCADAIEACYVLCPVTELSQADYYVRRTLRFQQTGRTLRGVGRYSLEAGEATRIILSASAANAAAADIMLVGTMDAPSGKNLTRDSHFSDFVLLREGRSAPHRSGVLRLYPAGLRASFLERCSFARMSSLESSIGFYIGNVVYTKFDDCIAQRLKAGAGGGVDRWIGYFLNATIGFGYAGGNASLYMTRCLTADQHGSHADPMGLYAEGAFVDSFIDQFESARVATGMAFFAKAFRGYGQTIDLHIRNAVLDGCARAGIDINLDATSSATIDIVDPYIAGGGAPDARGISIRDGAGLTTIVGGQIHGDFAGGSLFLNQTRAVTVQGLKIQHARRAVVVGAASNLLLEPQINNYQFTSSSFAVECDYLTRSIVRPTIIGAAGPAFRGGISLGPRSDHNHIDPTGVDPSCFTDPDAGFKVWFAGADARAGQRRAAFAERGNVLSGVLS